MNLFQWIYGDSMHQLAAGEVTDADDEISRRNFLCQVLAFRVVELIGPVEGQRESDPNPKTVRT